jgi:hypothetical protein
MKTLLLATACAAAFIAPSQAQSVTSHCRAAGQALGYATGNRYLGQQYDMSCQVLTPLPKGISPEQQRLMAEQELKDKEMDRFYEALRNAKPTDSHNSIWTPPVRP